LASLAQGEKALAELIKTLPPETNFNEAQTRFHVIDKVLFDCFGWCRDSEVEIEKSEDQQFTDYELGKPQRLAILEAKREGIQFEIPAGASEKLITDVESIRRVSKEARKAVDQVQSYCSLRGTPVAIISNGQQYIAFLGSRQDGKSVLDGKAVVFDSLQRLKDNFNLAWQLLSSEGIKERRINRYLVSGETNLPNKLSSRLINYPKARYKSDIQSTLRSLSELFLQDAVDNDEIEKQFFIECYCESGALSQYALLSKNILEARYASLFSQTEPHPHLSSVRDRKKDNFTPDVLSEAISKRPIVLLGDVGVGKTSFIKNLIYNSAYDEFKSALYIYIDLGSKAALADNLKIFILSEIERQLNHVYELDPYEIGIVKGVYASEISRFSKGIWGGKKESNPELYETKLFEKLEELMSEKDQHLKRVIGHSSKSSQRQIIVCLDNADQRDFEVQQDTFVISQELAQDWDATVFVSVRPQTFFRSKRSGALNAYPHKVFTISPPRIDKVIEKRLMFALKMAEGSVSSDIHRGFEVNAQSLALFLKALLSSLRENPDLLEFLSNITGGNIRAAIEFVTGFIGSPGVDAEKIISTMDTQGRYRIPVHEFTKQALLGEYSHYNPDTSIAMNVFDILNSDTNEHFLAPVILAFLNLSGEHRDNDGFCLSNIMFSELQGMGFTSEQIEKSLRRCTNKKLIESSERVTFEEDVNGTLIGEMPGSFRITSIGAYHLRRWMGQFTYLDAMVFDTPILSRSTREALSDNLESLAIDARYKRAEEFKKYLINCWNGFSQSPSYFNLNEIFSEGEDSFRRVANAIRKNQQEGSGR
jgi:predicted type IV restriction endonuclease/GTPase SAR1 family protein